MHMKRIFTLFVLFSSVIFIKAGGGWACSVVNIYKAGNPYSYTLNNDIGWTDGDWLYNQSFQDFDFGTPESLILNGGYGDGWTDDSPGYDATSFKIYYRVYESSATLGEWNVIDLNNSYF